MNEQMNVYKTWAPADSVWSRWVKPVLFMNIPITPSLTRDTHDVAWFGEFREDTAIILDLPGYTGIEKAIAFAKIGYRPVPLYNGVNPKPSEVKIGTEVKTDDLAKLLFQATPDLASINIAPDAPPVFMLDATRKGKGKAPSTPGIYDNRWNIFAQDLPSADFLRSRGIRNIMVVHPGSTIETDLEHVLYRYAEKKVFKFSRYDGFTVKPLSVQKPKAYKNAAYRLMVMLGLRRNAAGGFGLLIPEPSESSGGG